MVGCMVTFAAVNCRVGFLSLRRRNNRTQLLLTVVKTARGKIVSFVLIAILHVLASMFGLRAYCRTRATCAVLAPSNKSGTREYDSKPRRDDSSCQPRRRGFACSIGCANIRPDVRDRHHS